MLLCRKYQQIEEQQKEQQAEQAAAALQRRKQLRARHDDLMRKPWIRPASPCKPILKKGDGARRRRRAVARSLEKAAAELHAQQQCTSAWAQACRDRSQQTVRSSREQLRHFIAAQRVRQRSSPELDEQPKLAWRDAKLLAAEDFRALVGAPNVAPIGGGIPHEDWQQPEAEGSSHQLGGTDELELTFAQAASSMGAVGGLTRAPPPHQDAANEASVQDAEPCMATAHHDLTAAYNMAANHDVAPGTPESKQCTSQGSGTGHEAAQPSVTSATSAVPAQRNSHLQPAPAAPQHPLAPPLQPLAAPQVASHLLNAVCASQALPAPRGAAPAARQSDVRAGPPSVTNGLSFAPLVQSNVPRQERSEAMCAAAGAARTATQNAAEMRKSSAAEGSVTVSQPWLLEALLQPDQSQEAHHVLRKAGQRDEPSSDASAAASLEAAESVADGSKLRRSTVESQVSSTIPAITFHASHDGHADSGADSVLAAHAPDRTHRVQSDASAEQEELRRLLQASTTSTALSADGDVLHTSAVFGRHMFSDTQGSAADANRSQQHSVRQSMRSAEVLQLDSHSGAQPSRSAATAPSGNQHAAQPFWGGMKHPEPAGPFAVQTRHVVGGGTISLRCSVSLDQGKDLAAPPSAAATPHVPNSSSASHVTRHAGACNAPQAKPGTMASMMADVANLRRLREQLSSEIAAMKAPQVQQDISQQAERGGMQQPEEHAGIQCGAAGAQSAGQQHSLSQAGARSHHAQRSRHQQDRVHGQHAERQGGSARTVPAGAAVPFENNSGPCMVG